MYGQYIDKYCAYVVSYIPVSNRTYAVGAFMGGLEGECPPKNLSFPAVSAAKPPIQREIRDI
jgi:hypothetical protein